MSTKLKNNKRNRKARRAKLNKYLGEEITCIGDFEMYAESNFFHEGMRCKTLLLKNVRFDTGEILADHLWLKLSDVRNYRLIRGKKLKFIKFKGTPYFYNVDGCGKIQKVKFSLRDITIIYYKEKRLVETEEREERLP